jgi:hypothetical protein
MSDVPLTIVRLTIERELLPEWFDAVQAVAARHARRMAVIDQPDQYVVQVELPVADKDAFADGLQAAWTTFVDQRRAEGRWQEP